ncbi:MAG: DoxX family membrane protein [Chthoniobacterales bacterium]|nr:DoxX family membrane protein [Chthoniobacterales bacterium]
MKRAAILAIRILLGGLFLAAGLSKVGAPLQTLATVYSYQIVLPDWLANTIAHTLPWMEILLGLGLIAGLWLPVTVGWTAATLAVFTALTAQAWWRELPIDCGCIDLSAIHPALAALTTPGGATMRNLVLLVLCGVLLRWSREHCAK